MAKRGGSATGRYVKYVGLSHVREISRKDWDNVNVNHDTVRWDRSNGYMVALEDISDDAMPFIEADSELVISDGPADLSEANTDELANKADAKVGRAPSENTA